MKKVNFDLKFKEPFHCIYIRGFTCSACFEGTRLWPINTTGDQICSSKDLVILYTIYNTVMPLSHYHSLYLIFKTANAGPGQVPPSLVLSQYLHKLQTILRYADLQTFPMDCQGYRNFIGTSLLGLQASRAQECPNVAFRDLPGLGILALPRGSG